MSRLAAVLASLLALVSTTTIAVPPPPVPHNCISQGEYVSRGGELSQIRPPEFSAIETSDLSLFASRDGSEMVFAAGYIEADGEPSIMDSIAALTCFSKRYSDRAGSSGISVDDFDQACMNRVDTILTVLSKVRYKPPVLAGKSVCVGVRWKIKFANHTAQIEP